MIRDLIADIIVKSVVALQDSGELPHVEMPTIEVERPKQPDHGDYATNIAMKLAAALRANGQQKVNPRALGESIAARIRETVDVVPAYELVRSVEVEGPGFINVRLNPLWLLRQVGEVLAAGNTLGCSTLGRGQNINLEFVSANPTGPVTVGNGRGAFIGDTLGNVMRAAGYTVTKEYYFNDAGGQITKLGRSMEYYLWLALGENETAERALASIPQEKGHKEGYYGPYYASIARAMLDAGGRELLDCAEGERADRIGSRAAMTIMDDIKRTMAHMRVEFDVWFNQASLETSGALEESVHVLRTLGYIEEREGATWVKTTEFGDDKDRVIIRSSGDPTYFASDVAYMRNKFERGFDRLIYILGPDHHGYIGRLKAIAGVLGKPLDAAHVLIYQQVSLKVDGKPVKMGKRLGNIVTLDELDEDIGADVTRFFYLMRSNDTPLDFDLDLARKHTDENPGLSVQYAHARCAGVFRKARDLGITEEDYGQADTTVLTDDPIEERQYELTLMRQLLRLEEVIERIALTLEPHHLTRYGMDLADAFHLFYDHCPILKQGVVITEAQRNARLRLLRAAQAGLERTLTLLGMSAPERMEREEPSPEATT
ncbi:MAG: arginine--tRNA ligase [Ktedonobacterales bacterium]|nr:arginine--tRNA ligase [Ktedonobacterales bacterium]